MQTVTITYTKFTGFAADDSLPSHVQVSGEFQLITACSPAMLINVADPLLQFDFDLGEGWTGFDCSLSDVRVPADATRQCILKHRDLCAAEMNRRASDYNSGNWTREEMIEAVQELNAEVADAERLHCGSAEILPLVVSLPRAR